MFIKVKFVKVRESAKVPERGSKFAAGYDLSACIPDMERVIIHPGETVKIPTGLAIETPEGYFGGIYARSGLSTKQGLRPANCTGIADSDYRGEFIVALHNDSNEIRVVEHGQRIAQLVIQPHLNVEFEEVDKLEDTERGEGGFGSSGV